MEQESVFKKGDKVFDIHYGWGIVVEVFRKHYPVHVRFEEMCGNISYTFDGIRLDKFPQTLSFTEYNLVTGGFSQERPIDWSQYISCWGIFKSEGELCDIGKLAATDGRLFTRYDGANYEAFIPLTEEQVKHLKLP